MYTYQRTRGLHSAINLPDRYGNYVSIAVWDEADETVLNSLLQMSRGKDLWSGSGPAFRMTRFSTDRRSQVFRSRRLVQAKGYMYLPPFLF